ncbi:hypothetical protein HXY33_02265 [Candidatus Bathyarchaeota archaeon]|nr:hypothetical protein [Candidatus Bathyarchaeota archaeon]
MSDDHAFIDDSGEITKGKSVMKEDWRKFFEDYPDYRNVFTSVVVQNDVAVMVGCSICS